ncbi:MAG TPA: prolyl oligopeptidase family serine peptidase, partial [Caldimonas sp.]
EDVTDWAIKEGIADPGRICLSGASYGGYATLMGLAKTPDKYRCGVAGLAVTDLEMIMTSAVGDIANNEGAVSFWQAMVREPGKDSAELEAASPAFLADRIKAPVLMYCGADDIRVTLEQTQKMRRALESRGKKVWWIVKNEEGHGYGRTENNVDLYTQILEFLAQNIGP